MTTLLAAILLVESSGNLNPPDGAMGEVGPLQVRECVVRDINRIMNLKPPAAYTLRDMRNVLHAQTVFLLYTNHYATEKRLGRPVTDQDRARIWCGGPDGWKQPSTLPYWRKVQRAMATTRKDSGR